MRIVVTHLLNDYSGSPKVLMQLLKGFTKNNLEVHLFTSKNSNGFLSEINQIQYHFFNYHFSKNKLLRLLNYLLSQLTLFFKLLFFLKKTDIVYINTVLPFGVALIAKLKSCRIIYHIHETSIKPILLKHFLFRIVAFSANEVIYVSNFLAHQEPLNVKKKVLYNVLEKSFVEKAKKKLNHEKKEKIVLMICSLKKYKGIDEFVCLSRANPLFIFKLVLNATTKEINLYFKNEKLPKNLIIYPAQKDIHLFYEEASLLINLSDVNVWIETFGLTVLEGMAYGLPAIVPPVGGVVELINHGINGFLIDSKDITTLTNKINELFSNNNLYNYMSKNALEKSTFFGEDYFEDESLRLISKK